MHQDDRERASSRHVGVCATKVDTHRSDTSSLQMVHRHLHNYARPPVRAAYSAPGDNNNLALVVFLNLD